MKATNKTVGQLFVDAINRYPDENQRDCFAAGFIHGQAEKVHLGACAASMFRPAAHDMFHRREVAAGAAQRYGLVLRGLDTSRGTELWLIAMKVVPVAFGGGGVGHSPVDYFEMLVKEPENTPRWHKLRAALCGVPYFEWDEKYHQRRKQKRRKAKRRAK